MREILRVLVNAVPNGLRFGRVVEFTKLSTRTVTKHLKMLENDGCILHKDGLYYVTRKGVDLLQSILHEISWEKTFAKPSAWVFGFQEPGKNKNELLGFTVACESQSPYPFGDKEKEKKITERTTEYLEDVAAIMGGNPHKVNIKATITNNAGLYGFSEKEP